MIENPFKYASKLFLYLKKEKLTDEEKRGVEEVIETSSYMKKLFRELNDKEKISSELAIINSFDTQTAYNKILKKRNFKTRIPLLLKIAGILILAAVSIPIAFLQIKDSKYDAELIGSGKTILRASDGTVISLDTVSILKFQNNLSVNNEKGILTLAEQTEITNERKKGLNVVEVPYKGTYKIVLPDGTKVSLNSGSTLEFPDNFMTEERIVKLKGEAFFDVTKSGDRPFIVEVDDLSIKVLGTKFNVKSYNDEGRSYTTLLEGKIELSRNSDKKTIAPGEQVIFNKNLEVLDVKEIDTEPVVAWVDDMFYFDHTSLDEIMKSMRRWYGVDIHYEEDSQSVKNIVYSGKVKMYTHPEDILRKFEKIGGVKFKLVNNTIRISKNNK